jgi:hypothetical protein
VKRYPEPKRIDRLSFEEKKEFYARCSCDFHYFCEVVLGYHDMNDEHLALCQYLQNDPHRFRLVLMPRYTFKSTISDIGYILWKLVRNPDESALIYSDSSTKAAGFLQGIKNHIEGKARHSRFREFYPSWETSKSTADGKWNTEEIVISQRTYAQVEPSVDTGGIETSKVGRHYSIIIYDDIVSDLNITSKAQIDKVHECYTKSLSLLNPNGEVVMIGTRWHFSDLYGSIIDESKKADRWGVFIRQAAENDDLSGKMHFSNCGENSLTKEFLRQQKAIQSSFLFYCLYFNKPVNAEETLYKLENFKFYGELKKSSDPYTTGLYENLFTTLSLDPAGEGQDGTAGVVCGTDCNRRIYILELFCEKNCSPERMMDWIVRMNRKYRLGRVGIETTFFRGMLEKQLRQRIADEKANDSNFKMFSVEELLTRWRKGEGKGIRIEAMVGYHERGDILFPGNPAFALDDCTTQIKSLSGNFADLAYQMMQYTKRHMPEPNDLIDAMSWQIQLVQPGGRQEVEKIRKNSPEWMIEQSHAEEIKMQRYVPRFKRKQRLVW